jgi:alginate O-acetyltransferase complex protein AlgJ
MIRHFSAYFFLVFMILAAGLGIFAIFTTWQNLSAGQNLSHYTNGKAAVSFEKEFNRTLYSYDPSVLAWSVLNFTIYRQGAKGVIVGRDGWLFTDEEFSASPEEEGSLREKIDYIDGVQKILQDKGTQLVIVPVPSKARIYEEKLGRYRFPSYKKAVYNDFAAQMKQKNIAVCDLLTPLLASKNQIQLFFQRDTHWTPDGARLSAQTIKDCLNAQNLRPNITLRENFKIIPGESALHTGDLMRYLPIGALGQKYGITEEPYIPMSTESADEAIDESSLFTEQTPEVTLVGTSYSADEKWNFSGFLEYYLQTPVLNAADKGRGPFNTMKAYLENVSFKTAQPRLLIWEIPERYLSMPMNPEQK